MTKYLPQIYAALGSAAIVGAFLVSAFNMYLDTALAEHEREPHSQSVTQEQYTDIKTQVGRVQGVVDNNQEMSKLIQQQNEKAHQAIDKKLDKILEKLDQ
jgi:hypothetical protein